MPPERTSRRQEPASCESCRKKKLRCDRSQPCHNCSIRSIECLYIGRRPPPILNDNESDVPVGPSDAAELRAENANIRARLRRLEELMLKGDGAAEAATTGALGGGFSVSAGVTRGGDGTVRDLMSANLDSAPRSATVPTPPVTDHTQASTPENEQTKGYSDDSRWLESVGARGAGEFPHLGNGLRTQVLPLDETVVRASSKTLALQHIIIPRLPEATHLFRCYLDHVDALQHIIYVPHVTEKFKRLYEMLENGRPATPSHLALLLTVLANIGGFWALGSSPVQVFNSQAEALSLSTYWLRCTLDVLEHVWRTSPPDLETIQASITSLFLIYHMEGFSPKLRRLHAIALANAKDLGLHLTDSPHHGVKEDTQAQIIEADMRRRIWWHLSATDWSLSICGGPHDGTYTVQRKHMLVKKPRNINDADLATMPKDFERPANEATSATYYLQRIKLGETCREAADLIWELYTVQAFDEVPYQRIIDLDTKFGELLSGLPEGLRGVKDSSLEIGVTPGSSDHYGTRPTNIQLAKQKYFTYLTVQARRCKLHLPYLLRAQRQPRYQFSRQTCLDSARHVIELRHVLPFQKIEKPGTFKMIGLLHHFYCAIVVLVMDLCINRDTDVDLSDRKREIRNALMIFEDAKATSQAASCFLEALNAILKKHDVALNQYMFTSGGIFAPMAECVAETNMCKQGRPNGTFSDNLGIEDINFDGEWQSYFDFGQNPLEPAAWDALFSDLDMTAPAFPTSEQGVWY